MTPKRWLFLWSGIFVFIAVFFNPCSLPWYLAGFCMGAVLMIGLALMDGRET
jgi:hypothetical protein